MNIRIDNHSLRVRLNLSEIEDFLKKRKSEMSIDFGNILSQKLSFRFELSSEFNLISEVKNISIPNPSSNLNHTSDHDHSIACSEFTNSTHQLKISTPNNFKHDIGSSEFQITIFFPETSLIELQERSQFPVSKKKLHQTFLCSNFKGIDRVDLELDAFSISKPSKSALNTRATISSEETVDKLFNSNEPLP